MMIVYLHIKLNSEDKINQNELKLLYFNSVTDLEIIEK